MGLTVSDLSQDLGFTTSVNSTIKPQHWWVPGYSFDDLILSENHRRKGHGWDGGGPFLVRHKTCTPLPSLLINAQAGPLTGYQVASTRLTPNVAGQIFNARPSLPSYSSSGLEAAEKAASYPKGATGWKRSRPGNPTAAITNFLWELRDLPTLPVRMFLKLRNFKALGSEYLNIQFGWLPFVSDIKKMYATYRTLSAKLDQLVRDNGKGIRRKRDLGTTTSIVSSSSRLNNLGCFAPAVVSTGASWSQVDTDVLTLERYWFVGRFRYYVPDIGSDQWTKRATAALFGVIPTPAVLWEALPWSWLIDWFSNVGDIVSNLSGNAVDNLVADYAFIMHHKTVETRWSAVGYLAPGYNHGAFNPSCSISLKDETKSRMPATPYGFGVNFDGLSAYQLSILSALGMSRSRF